MSTNLSQQKREKLLNNIKIMREKLKENPELVKSLADIESELKRKKYGLVWEEHVERVDEEIKTKIPVFVEKKELEIKTDENKAINFLIEGDNLHSLYLLEKTHKEKIDVIYIDPPYNTGNKDFVYDDDFVDTEDGFKHSKWISFMERRLSIANNLLKKEGIICISIDDKEQSQLKLLCDEIFGEDNFIACLARRTKSSGKTTNKISSNHDYVLIYEKTKNESKIIGLPHIDEGFKYEDEYVNERGKYKLNQTLDYDSLSYSPSLDYPIEIEGKTLYAGGNYEKYLERQKGNYNRADWAWRWSKDLFEFGLENGFIVLKKGKDGLPRIYTKTYLNAKIEKDNNVYKIVTQERTKALSSIEFIDAKYSNDNAKKDLLKIFKNANFDYPKPIELISTLLKIYDNKNAFVLDFFAGSGTTAHSVIELNRSDNGNRHFILCTNNQNNICEEITYKRLKNVNENIERFNLKYYKTEYIDRFNHEDEGYYIVNELSKYIKELVQLENGIDINNHTIQICFTDEEIDDLVNNSDIISQCELLYVDTNALITEEQMKVFEENNIKILYIPEYYFEEEIMEVEQW